VVIEPISVHLLTLNGTDGTDEDSAMASKAPNVYRCPCCGSTFVHRRAKACPQCAIPLHLEGEYMVEPCYLYCKRLTNTPVRQGRPCAELFG